MHNDWKLGSNGQGKSFRLQLLDRYTSGFRAVSGLFFLFVSPFLQRNSHQVLPRNDRKCLDDLREIDVWRVVDKHSALLCPSRDTIINQ